MKKFLLVCFSFVFALSAIAQDRVISGKVSLKEDSSPLPGVNVVQKGTANGTVTDVNGDYKLSVPPGGATLIFSFIGMATQEIEVGDRGTIDVTMAADMTQLGEVVVTALGIGRKEASLGYSASTVSSADVSQGRSFSPINGLQGKVAGVIVSSGSGQPGAQTIVNIRGLTSLGGSNQPLYVVDGVPINNTFNNYTSDANNANRQQDFGNRANDFNPEDIESITVLKSASSTVLYGSRAASGVILITTKKGKAGDGVKVNFTSSATFSDPLRIPTSQQNFGQGWNSVNDYTQNGSWGPAFDGRDRVWGNVVDNSQQIKPYKPLNSNVRDFYEKGTSFINTISLSGGTDRTSYIFSYANTKEDGIIPTNADSYNRNNFSFRGSYTGKKLSVSSSINYILKNAKTVTVGQGSNGATMFQELLQIPTDISVIDMKDYHNKFQNLDNYYTPYNQNPYFVLNENGNKFVENRLQGNINFNYAFNSWLSATARIGTDVANNSVKDWIAIANFDNNGYNASEIDVPGTVFNRGNYTRESNSDILINLNKSLSSNFHLNAFIGNNINQRESDAYTIYASKLNVPGFYNLANSSNPPTYASAISKRRLIGAYAQAEIAFKEFLYLTVQTRNDWSSTLPKGKNSYLYSGASLSFVFTDLMPSLQNIVSFGKLRVNIGKTGKDAPVYYTKNVFVPSTIGLPFGQLNFPLSGVNGYEVSNQLGNPSLKPEFTNEVEAGLELKFFQGRVAIDASVYNRNTTNQILSQLVATSTGYGSQIVNFGKIQNKGLELLVTLVPLKTTNFMWTLASNWTVNRNKVLDLGSLDEYLFTNIYDVDFVAIKGQPLGVFKAPKQATDAQGHTIVNGQGIPTAAPDKEILGNMQSKFVTGLTNQFNYKNLSFSFTFDYRAGGLMYSYTKRLMEFVGNSTNTIYNNRQPFIVPNSVKPSGTNDVDGNPTYVENDIPVNMNNTTEYFNSATNLALQRGHVIDRTYLKLREVVLTYNIPKSLLSKTFIQNLSVSLIGRNLWLKTPASNNVIDPEITAYPGDTNTAYAGEFSVTPTVRSYGVSVRLGF